MFFKRIFFLGKRSSCQDVPTCSPISGISREYQGFNEKVILDHFISVNKINSQKKDFVKDVSFIYYIGDK